MCGMLGPYAVQSTPPMAPSSIKLSPTHHSSGGSSSGSSGTTVATSEAAGGTASSYQNGYLGASAAAAAAAASHSGYTRDFLLRSREMSSFADFGSAATFAAQDPFTGLHAAAADPAMAAYGMASAHQASAAAANQMYPSYMNGTNSFEHHKTCQKASNLTKFIMIFHNFISI